ncbi:HAD-IA family hydrolase [Maribellus comscasis]|uniref:HAD-IA family hydrolase n=1 Tax=Maribellus comscasis TaxID=2681766 RepID=A0A6I6K4A4_9BACT|nr:HAD family phosphatase [Maribellus comscasis]QGY44814.1 HAD-IA family hydrolase [Maribellus comscasis]
MTDTIFFDLDGVIINSEPLHCKTKALALDAFQIQYPEDIFDKFKGVPEDKFFIYVSEHLDPQHRPYALLQVKRQEILADFLPELPTVEGFFDFFEFIKNKNFRKALVTSSTDQELKNIDKHLGILSLFDQIVSADLTKYHKPHPAPYLKALEIMQTKTENCVIIEDAPNGIISGKKAGCKVYALTTSFKKEELAQAGADKIFDNYKQIKETF